jgi:hypothetical protein
MQDGITVENVLYSESSPFKWSDACSIISAWFTWKFRRRFCWVCIYVLCFPKQPSSNVAYVQKLIARCQPETYLASVLHPIKYLNRCLTYKWRLPKRTSYALSDKLTFAASPHNIDLRRSVLAVAVASEITMQFHICTESVEIKVVKLNDPKGTKREHEGYYEL